MPKPKVTKNLKEAFFCPHPSYHLQPHSSNPLLIRIAPRDSSACGAACCSTGPGGASFQATPWARASAACGATFCLNLQNGRNSSGIVPPPMPLGKRPFNEAASDSEGSLQLLVRADGTRAWNYRWRERRKDGTLHSRKKDLG